MDTFALTKWLGVVLKEARETAGLSMNELYKATDLQPATQSRFERGEAGAQDLDALVAAYASATGQRPADLWRAALDLCERDPAGRKPATAARIRAAVRRARATP